MVPFDPWPGQQRLIQVVEGGGWVCAPKARRLGVTLITLARILWECCYRIHQDCALISQKEDTAKGLLRKYKQLEDSLPDWLRVAHTKENESEIEYSGTGSRVKIYIGNQGAARSEGLTFLFVDEACYVAALDKILRGAEPGVESSGGSIVVASTTSQEDERPVSLEAFRRLYYASKLGETKFAPLFLDPFERPDRDKAWYEEEERTHRHIPGYMAKEYPRDDEEAFSKSGGAVFVHLDKKTHFIDRRSAAEILSRDGVQIYRGIDFGDTEGSCFVCGWVAHDEDGPPRLLFADGTDEVLTSERGSMGWSNGYEELFAYKRDPVSSRLEKKNDNVADMLRYVVTMYRMRGTVLVYRLLFVRQDDDFQVSPVDLFKRVISMSGFVCTDEEKNEFKRTPDSEDYVATVCDRSATGWIKLLREQRTPMGFGLDAVAYEKPDEFTRNEREQGVVWLKALLMGDQPWEVTQEVDPTKEIRERYDAGEPARDINEQVKYRIWDACKVGEQKKKDAEGGGWVGMERIPLGKKGSGVGRARWAS
jgi:hypothetical protein